MCLNNNNINKTILAKDLKLFAWTDTFALSLKGLSLTSEELPEFNDEDFVFFSNIAAYFWNRKIYDNGFQDAYNSPWYFHVWYFRALDNAGRGHHGRAEMPFKEERNANAVILEVKNGEAYSPRGELADLFQKVINYWFSFPTLINDFYKNSIEESLAPDLEKVLLKHWLELPAIISELYNLLICFFPQYFCSSAYLDANAWKPFDKTLSAMPSTKIEVSLHDFSWFSHLQEDTFYYPQTKSVVKVFKEKGEIIPKNLDELLALYKEGLQPWFIDFEYFFKFLEEHREFSTELPLSEALCLLLVYNPPFPMSLMKATHPQTQEEYEEAYAIRESNKRKNWGI